MTQQEILRTLAQKTKISQAQLRGLMRAFEDSVAETILGMETLVLSGLGRFETLKVGPREVPDPRNPGRKLKIAAAVLPRFYPSPALREKVRGIKPKTGQLDRGVARKISYPYIDLSKVTVDKAILALVPEKIARRFQLAPVEKHEQSLTVAMIDPEDREAVELVKKQTGLALEVKITTQADLNHILDQYAALGEKLGEITKEEEITPVKKPTGRVKPEALAEEAPAAKVISQLLRQAVRNKASDIHIEPGEEDSVIRFRIDGILRKVTKLPATIHPAVVSRIKILSNLKIDETRLPQDGRFEAVIDRGSVDFRVSILPTIKGEKAVMRILNKAAGIITLEELGVKGLSFKLLEETITKAHGMTLVTGPTGSGKTTTLYAVLDRINQEGINIVTLEDPVEYRMAGINQSQVKAEIGFSFASGLRSIVRQDPDVIMVGEIRDQESASLAVHAALTGHIVLSTLHTNDAVGAIPRLIDMGIEAFLITSSLNSVVAQRLVRKICPDCKAAVQLPEASLSEVKKEIAALPESEKKELRTKSLSFFKGKGCSACGDSGYRGRLGIFEILPLTEGIKKVAGEKPESDAILAQARQEGFISMKQDGILKALSGETTLEEVFRATKV